MKKINTSLSRRERKLLGRIQFLVKDFSPGFWPNELGVLLWFLSLNDPSQFLANANRRELRSYSQVLISTYFTCSSKF